MSADAFGRVNRDGFGKPVTDHGPRCWKCNRLLAVLVTRPWRIICNRCKATNSGGEVPTNG